MTSYEQFVARMKAEQERAEVIDGAHLSDRPDPRIRSDITVNINVGDASEFRHSNRQIMERVRLAMQSHRDRHAAVAEGPGQRVAPPRRQPDATDTTPETTPCVLGAPKRDIKL